MGDGLHYHNLAGINNVIIDNGSVGINVDNPIAKLDINGQISIRGGNPSAGKILTSDDNGLASWQESTIPPNCFGESAYLQYNNGWICSNSSIPNGLLSYQHIVSSNPKYYRPLPLESEVDKDGNNSAYINIKALTKEWQHREDTIPFNEDDVLTLYGHGMCWFNDQPKTKVEFLKTDGSVDGYFLFSGPTQWRGQIEVYKNGVKIAHHTEFTGAHSKIISGTLSFNNNVLAYTHLDEIGWSYHLNDMSIVYDFSEVTSMRITNSLYLSAGYFTCGVENKVYLNYTPD